MNPIQPRSSRAVRDQIVGKCIRGVIARPGRNGEPPMVMMMQFDDGSVLEFVSPRSDQVLKAAIRQTRDAQGNSRSVSRANAQTAPDQLALAVM
ncbi:MAG: hypothetical protein RQ741_04230 [Wenzhouxiangellaceae bacterium]|nr:hypothetical protein [Wenzhouxiangellaceae bacterium]